MQKLKSCFREILADSSLTLVKLLILLIFIKDITGGKEPSINVFKMKFYIPIGAYFYLLIGAVVCTSVLEFVRLITSPTSKRKELLAYIFTEQLLGDIQEERGERIQTFDIKAANRWYRQQVLTSFWPQLYRVMARMVSKIASR